MRFTGRPRSIPGEGSTRFGDKVYRRDVLERAWVDVRRNGGAAGIDRTSIADVQEYGVSRLLDELVADLKVGRWRPSPARRVFIPKSGSRELRPLSIPTVRDRIVQAAVKIVLRLGPQQPDVGQTVTADSDADRQIQQNLVRIQHRPGVFPLLWTRD